MSDKSASRITVHWGPVALALALAVGLGIVIFRSTDNILPPDVTSEWIAPDLVPWLGVFPSDRNYPCAYRREFTATEEHNPPFLSISATGNFAVFVNDAQVFRTPEGDENWIKRYFVSLPRLEDPSVAQQVRIEVDGYGNLGVLRIVSDNPMLASSTEWESRFRDQPWKPSRRAKEPTTPSISSLGHLNAERAMQLLLPALCVFGVFVWARRRHLSRDVAADRGEHLASQFRSILLGVWTIGMLLNIMRLPHNLGYDISAHMEYIRIVGVEHRLPDATEGWQTFQPPLFYMIAGFVYGIVDSFYAEQSIVVGLRVLTLLCGLAIVELSYRTARVLFPDAPALQITGMAVGGYLPVNLYMSHFVSNEPLAAALTALFIYGLISMLLVPKTSLRAAIVLGCVLGFAILAKVSAVIPGAVGVAAITVTIFRHPDWKPVAFGRRIAWLASMLVSTCVVAGWYFALMWSRTGRWFIGGWESRGDISWWQLPSYRVVEDLFRFGTAITRPVYSTFHSFWDGLYGTLFADGMLSGQIVAEAVPPWNYELIGLNSALSLVLVLLMFHGSTNGASGPDVSRRRVFTAIIAMLGLFILAMIHLFLNETGYSIVKASYMLSLAPCIGVLVVSGISRFYRNPVWDPIFIGVIGVWTVAAAGTYLFIWP